MQKLHYEFKSIADVKAKWSAAVELFGNSGVDLLLTGTWFDKKGEAVFFDITSSLPVDHMSPVYIYVDVDDGMTGVDGVGGKSTFKLVVHEVQR